MSDHGVSIRTGFGEQVKVVSEEVEVQGSLVNGHRVECEGLVADQLAVFDWPVEIARPLLQPVAVVPGNVFDASGLTCCFASSAVTVQTPFEAILEEVDCFLHHARGDMSAHRTPIDVEHSFCGGGACLGRVWFLVEFYRGDQDRGIGVGSDP